MKNIFKEAHKMTREMVEKYGVDYQAQFSLNLSYLLENKEEERKMKRNLKGTEKQIKWAEDILNIYDEIVNELEEVVRENGKEKNMNKIAELREILSSFEDAGEVINNYKEISQLKFKVDRYKQAHKDFKTMQEKTLSLKYITILKKREYARMEENGEMMDYL